MAITGRQLFANNAQSQLAGDITAGATTANLDSGGGALLPNPGANQFFLLTFVDAATGLINEIVKVTAMAGDTITTMARGQEGTSAKAWSAGDIAAAFDTAGTMTNLPQPPDLQTIGGDYGVDTGTANALSVATPASGVVPANLTALLGAPLRIKKSAAANTGAVTLAFAGLAATAVVNFSGNPLSAGDWPASGVGTVVYNGVNFRLQNSLPGGASAGRIVLTSSQDFYVATTGNDSNDGLTPGTPWLTLQHAINVVYNDYDLAGFNVVIHVADGTYAGGVTAVGVPPPGTNGPAAILFSGSTSAIVSTAGSCFVAQRGAMFAVAGLQLTSSGNNCLTATYGGMIEFSGTLFESAAAVHIEALNAGIILCTGAYSVAGGATNHWEVAYNSQIRIGNFAATFAITLTGTPAFSSSFAKSVDCSTIFCDSAGISFAGGATGKRYDAEVNGVIDTDAGGATYLPGSIAGTVATGGVYA